MPNLNMKFTEKDLVLATAIFNKAQFSGDAPSIETVSEEDDSLSFGNFFITKVAGKKDITPIDVRAAVASRLVDIVEFVITTEKHSFSFEDGDTSEEIDLGREETLQKAIIACKKFETEWNMENIIEGCLQDIEMASIFKA